jgi:hypothetical protein
VDLHAAYFGDALLIPAVECDEPRPALSRTAFSARRSKMR